MPFMFIFILLLIISDVGCILLKSDADVGVACSIFNADKSGDESRPLVLLLVPDENTSRSVLLPQLPLLLPLLLLVGILRKENRVPTEGVATGSAVIGAVGWDKNEF